MTTPREVIRWAFAEVVQSKTGPTEGEQSMALRFLNRLMAALEAKGYDVNYERTSNLDEELSVPDGVILAMVKNLAVKLWPQFNTDPINQLLQISANRTLKTMGAFSVNIDKAAQFPDTFPIGSGNDYGLYSDDFYYDPVRQAQVLVAENNGGDR